VLWFCCSIASGAELKLVTPLSPDRDQSSFKGRGYAYHWEMSQGTSCTAHFTLYRSSNTWFLNIPEGVIYLHHTNWKDDIGKYCGEEFLEMLGGSLRDFKTRETSGPLRDIHIGIHLVSPMWEEFISNFRTELKSVPRKAEPSWNYLHKKAIAALKGNAYVDKVQNVIEQTGYKVFFGPTQSGEKTPQFADKVDWPERAKQDDAGLSSPGYLYMKVYEPEKIR
jgi:hypothetical protein